MKRTFVVPEEKEEVYEKFKGMVPEVSSKIVELMEDFVNKNDAIQNGMTEQTIHDGTEYPHDNIFLGKTLKFYGTLLTKGKYEGDPTIVPDVDVQIFLTKKGKFLVYRVAAKTGSVETVCSYVVYNDYFEMKAKGNLSENFITACEEYLNKNSTIRTYELLDV